MKFDSYFNLMIAFAVKTVLTMINDESWQHDNPSRQVVKIYTLSEHTDVFGITELQVVALVNNLIKSQFSRIELSQYRKVIAEMVKSGDIETIQVGMTLFYHVSLGEIKKTLTVRQF